MTLFEGTYRLQRECGEWRCIVIFDGLIVEAYSCSRRRAFRKAHRAMVKAVKYRSVVSPFNVYGARTDCCDAVVITRSDKLRPYCARCEKEF